MVDKDRIRGSAAQAKGKVKEVVGKAIGDSKLAGWFTARWGRKAPSTWNVALDALRSASSYWQDQGWITSDPTIRLVKGRKAGPLFLTDRRARVELPPGDIDPASGRARLSYRQAAQLFSQATGGATLHQLRHSALTHDAEDGASTPMLLAKSGHTSVASLSRYARPSAESLARWQASRDPARRR